MVKVCYSLHSTDEAGTLRREVTIAAVPGDQLGLSDDEDRGFSPALIVYENYTDGGGVGLRASAIFAPGCWNWAQIKKEK